MTPMEEVQEICTAALEVAEHSASPQKTTIHELVSVILQLTETDRDLKTKAVNYLAELREGRKWPVGRTIHLVDEMVGRMM